MKFIKKNLISIFKRISAKLIFIKRKEIVRSKVNKILINSLYFRGDTVFHTPVFEALRYLFPNAEIDLWVKSRSYNIVKHNPKLNNIIIFDHLKTADYNDETRLNLIKKFRFIKGLRKSKYDLYIDLTGKYSTAIIAAIGGFRYSGGINYVGFGFLLNKFYDLNTDKTDGHLIDKYLSVVKNILSLKNKEWESVLTFVKSKPYLYITENERNIASALLGEKNIKGDKKIICIHLTAGWKAKELPSETYAELIDNFLVKNTYDWLLIGDVNDTYKINEIYECLREKINLKEKFITLPFSATIALIEMADLLIGADSAPLHIAGAVGTPSIALFGPTNPEFSKPRGSGHVLIYHELYCSAKQNHQFCTRNAGKTCQTWDCMNAIRAADINIQIEKILSIGKN